MSVPGPVILSIRGHTPRIAPDAFVAPTAAVIGDVEIGAQCAILFNVTIRGDIHSIRIGARTNIQDGSVVHVTGGKFGTFIGSEVTIGHMSMVHGCTLEDRSFVGMNATVMDGCVIESGGMLAAGALLTPGKKVGAGELWAGRPAKLMRPMNAEESENIAGTADRYSKLGQEYRAILAQMASR